MGRRACLATPDDAISRIVWSVSNYGRRHDDFRWSHLISHRFPSLTQRQKRARAGPVERRAQHDRSMKSISFRQCIKDLACLLGLRNALFKQGSIFLLWCISQARAVHSEASLTDLPALAASSADTLLYAVRSVEPDELFLMIYPPLKCRITHLRNAALPVQVIPVRVSFKSGQAGKAGWMSYRLM